MILGSSEKPRTRTGFTLLEVLLASAIAVMIMGALYVAVDMQLRTAQAGRDVVEKSTLARALFARMASDIAGSLAPALPANSTSGSSSAGGSTAGGAASSTTGGSQAASTTTPSTSASAGQSTFSSNGASTGTTSTSGPTNAVTFNYGVQGTNQTLTLSASRFPRTSMLAALANPENASGFSDERYVSYWLAGSGGLARQEIKLVTSTDALTNLPPNVSDEDSFVIAPEVRQLNFRFFDGSEWNDTWDGTVAGTDGVTPIGPPVAIEITLGVAVRTVDEQAGVEPAIKNYRRVVFMPTANGATLPSTTSSSQ